jgi:hypothetical protein
MTGDTSMAQAPQRFRITHEGDTIGTTLFEGGDPDARGVSGQLHNPAGSRALAGWILSIGGSEDDGAVFVEMDSNFRIQDGEGTDIPFGEATLIALPGEDEAYIDVSGIPEERYYALFMHHVTAVLDGDHPAPEE